MTNPFDARARAFDAKAIKQTIRQALESAGLGTHAGPLQRAVQTIQRALAAGGLATDPQAPGAAAGEPVIDVSATVIEVGEDSVARPGPERPIGGAQAPGRFESHEFSNHAGTRQYKVYVPARLPDVPLPVVVMLHGCTQSADDFAAGTQMNRLADEHGVLVVYPEQAAQANPSRCWNWFKAQDQVRDGGEPSLIAGIAREVAARHGADPRRIFVAGLSAGAAMAVVLGETYPELFAGVGAHSGLAYGSAHDIPSALAAMKGGRSGLPGLAGLAVATEAPARQAARPVPTIVFHGDRDHTVQQTNGAEIARQAVAAHASTAGEPPRGTPTERGVAPGGRSYTRTVHAGAQGHAHIECWTVHGAGHAWSGGHASGSYTDAAGPDASAEMLRFFLSLPHAGSS
jgi:poly(hydroxyalkanoate) depolymerase family esterase